MTRRIMQGKGWKPGMGSRPEEYRAAEVLPRRLPGVTSRNWWPSGWWGDQGYTAECTIYSWLHVLHDGPITHRRAVEPMANPTMLYHEGQDIDGTPRRDVYSGLTSDAAAQVMLKRGFIGEYRWALTLDEMIGALLLAGPLTFGIWWRDQMNYPDSNGYVRYAGDHYGAGHQFAVNGVNTKKRVMRCKNSWGRGWGKNGFFYMHFEDVERALDEGGEACIMRELLDLGGL